MANQAYNQIHRLLPRHLEVMHRLVLGQREIDIANDLEISQNHISRIVNSPLFQVELRRMLKQREEKVLRIQENVLDAGDSASLLYKNVLANVDISLDLRLKAGLGILNLVGRIAKSSVPLSEGPSEDTDGYEKRLTREVIMRETEYSPQRSERSSEGLPLSFDETDSYPPNDLLRDEEEDAISDRGDDGNGDDNDDKNDDEPEKGEKSE